MIDQQLVDLQGGVSGSAVRPRDLARDLMRHVGHQAVGVVAVGSLGRRAAEGPQRSEIHVQDWDLVVIAKKLKEWERLLLRRSIRRLLRVNAASRPAAVSVGILRQEGLRRLPFTLFNYEMRYAHEHLAGSDPLGALPKYQADQMPLIEATRLLLNRGVSLWGNCVISKRDLQTVGQRLVQFAERNRKALLAMGDALLIADGCYHWSYRVRAERAAACAALELLGGEARRGYVTALEMKHSGMSPGRPDPLALCSEAQSLLRLHERVFTFVEERRLGGPLGDWIEYLDNRADYPRYLRPPTLKRFARRLRGFGIPRSLAFGSTQLGRTDEEILLRAFPALAYRRLADRSILDRFLNWPHTCAMSPNNVWRRFHSIWARGH